MQDLRLKSLASFTAVLAVVVTSVLLAPPALAHETSAYSHDATTGTVNADWMAGIPGQLRLSELSIPGSHDTGAYRFGGDAVETQSMALSAQLNAGIRAWDMRLRNVSGDLKVYHGIAPQFLDFEVDVLPSAVAFLQAHPGETILMRIKREGGPVDGFDDLVQAHLDQVSSYVYHADSDNPTLAAMRGKIVVLQNFNSDTDFGIPWGSLSIQDDYHLDTNWDLADKWLAVEDHLDDADGGALGTTFVNFLSGSGGSFPYFVASGHSNPATGAPRLATGATRGVIDTCDEDSWCIDEFPSVDCFLGTCTVAFEGTNVMTMNYIDTGKVDRRIGLVMSDFPGAGLIESVIGLNPYNWPPTADAGGPYTGHEGTAITFDASASTDRDGDVLNFRWDFDGDGTWDTEPSTSPTTTQTWNDDHSGTVSVEVDDGHHTDTASTPVTIDNVAPAVTAGASAINENRTATVRGTITDPGTTDAFTVEINWGEGDPETHTYPAGTTNYSAQHRYLDDNPTGTPVDTYPITVTITDDDAGVGTASSTVDVANLAPVTSIDQLVDETGTPVGDRVILRLLTLDLAGSFTDVGTLDTHTATIDWGDGTATDLGATTGTVGSDHTYTDPGRYTITLDVTDDDTGHGSTTAHITVVNGTDAITITATDLLDHADDPELSPAAAAAIRSAVDHITGNSNGTAANGALDLLAKGNQNAALGMLTKAIEDLARAEQTGNIDLTRAKSLLALSAKSITTAAINTAAAEATKPNELRKVHNATAVAAEGDSDLSNPYYAAAIGHYQSAIRAVHNLLR